MELHSATCLKACWGSKGHSMIWHWRVPWGWLLLWAEEKLCVKWSMSPKALAVQHRPLVERQPPLTKCIDRRHSAASVCLPMLPWVFAHPPVLVSFLDYSSSSYWIKGSDMGIVILQTTVPSSTPNGYMQFLDSETVPKIGIASIPYLEVSHRHLVDHYGKQGSRTGRCFF